MNVCIYACSDVVCGYCSAVGGVCVADHTLELPFVFDLSSVHPLPHHLHPVGAVYWLPAVQVVAARMKEVQVWLAPLMCLFYMCVVCSPLYRTWPGRVASSSPVSVHCCVSVVIAHRSVSARATMSLYLYVSLVEWDCRCLWIELSYRRCVCGGVTRRCISVPVVSLLLCVV